MLQRVYLNLKTFNILCHDTLLLKTVLAEHKLRYYRSDSDSEYHEEYQKPLVQVR
jgi:hypothetical protein